LPPLSLLRFPAKAMVVVAVAVSVLAGMGVDAWTRFERRGRLAASAAATTVVALALAAGLGGAGLTPETAPAPFLSVAAALAAAGAVAAGLRRPGRAGFWARLAGCVAVADLAHANGSLNPTAPREFFLYRPPMLDGIVQDDYRRLLVVDYLADADLSQRLLGRALPYLVPSPPGRRLPRWSGALGLRSYPVPPVASAWGFEQSYSRDLLGIQPVALARLNAAATRSLGTPTHLRFLRLGAVRDVLALHDAQADGLLPGPASPGPFFEPIRTFRVPDPLPRAYAVSGVRIADGADAVTGLLSDAFDPTREVVLPGGSARRPDPAFRGTVRILKLDPDRVRLEAEANGPAHVVLADAYDPGWQASVDGSEATLLRANLAFRAVPIPAGRHAIELAYRPRSVGVGLAFSASAFLVAVVIGRRR
jgi:hypothetical protein